MASKKLAYLKLEVGNTCDCVGDDVEIRPPPKDLPPPPKPPPPPKDPPPPPRPPPARETYTVCTGLLLFVLTKLKRKSVK